MYSELLLYVLKPMTKF